MCGDVIWPPPNVTFARVGAGDKQNAYPKHTVYRSETWEEKKVHEKWPRKRKRER